MPYFLASACALPGVGEATATTSASSGMIWNEAAWISASNCDPMIPTFTFPFGMRVSGNGAVADALAFRIVEERLTLAVRAHGQIDRSHHLVAHVGVTVGLLPRPDALEKVIDMLLVAFVTDA